MRAPRIKIKPRKSLRLQLKYTNNNYACEETDCIAYDYPRLTRSMTKLANEFNFYVYETYKCMPLLGNEKENAPNWEVHVVNYRVAFVKKKVLT